MRPTAWRLLVRLSLEESGERCHHSSTSYPSITKLREFYPSARSRSLNAVTLSFPLQICQRTPAARWAEGRPHVRDVNPPTPDRICSSDFYSPSPCSGEEFSSGVATDGPRVDRPQREIINCARKMHSNKTRQTDRLCCKWRQSQRSRLCSQCAPTVRMQCH